MSPPITRPHSPSHSPSRSSATASGSRPVPEPPGSAPRQRSTAAVTAGPLSTARSAPLVAPPRTAAPGARPRPTDAVAVALHATRDRVGYFLHTAESLQSADYGPRAATRLRNAFGGDAVPTAEDVGLLVRNSLLTSEQALRYFACAAQFHPGPGGMEAARQCHEMAASALAAIPPERRQERVQVIRDLRALHAKLPDARRRECIEPILLRASEFAEARDARSLAKAKEHLRDTEAIYKRVAHVRSERDLVLEEVPEEITGTQRPGAPRPEAQRPESRAAQAGAHGWPGRRQSPVDEIRQRVLGPDGRVNLENLEQEMYISTATSMLDFFNSMSWARDLPGGRKLGVVAAAAQELRSRGYDKFVPGPPLDESGAADAAMATVAFLKRFKPYLEPMLTQGGMPVVATQERLAQEHGANAQVVFPKSAPHLKLMQLDTDPEVDFATLLTHENAHAYESSESIAATRSRPAPDGKAVTESTADYLKKLVDGEVGVYENEYKVTAMMGAVLDEVRKSLGIDLESDAVALDTVLRAHFKGDTDAVEHVNGAWDKVLRTPDFRQARSATTCEAVTLGVALVGLAVLSRTYLGK